MATVGMPWARAVRRTRQAISPRLAMRILRKGGGGVASAEKYLEGLLLEDRRGDDGCAAVAFASDVRQHGDDVVLEGEDRSRVDSNLPDDMTKVVMELAVIDDV